MPQPQPLRLVLDAAEPHPQLPLRVLELAFELPHEDVPQVEVLREVLQPQLLPHEVSRRGGKNSSTGKSKRENTSQGSIKHETPYLRYQPHTFEVVESTKTDSQTITYGPDYHDSFENELRYYHDCIESGKQPKTTFEDAMEDIKMFQDICSKI